MAVRIRPRNPGVSLFSTLFHFGNLYGQSHACRHLGNSNWHQAVLVSTSYSFSFSMRTPLTLLRRLKPRALGAWLALAFTALSIVLTLVLTAVIERKATEQVKSSIGNGLAELAMQTSDKLERGMFERYREVSLIAQLRELQPDEPQDRRRRALERVQASYGYYSWIGVAGLDGRVQASARGLLEGADVSARPWFKHALEGIHAGDVHEAVLLSSLLPRQAEPWRFVDVAFPVRGADGSVQGVLGAHLSWQWARDVERSMMAGIARRRQVEALIVDAGGKVLLGPADTVGKRLDLASLAEARSDRRWGYLDERWTDGKSYLVGYARGRGYGEYPGLGWTVLVRQKVDTAFVPIALLRQYALASGIALALLFSVAGAFVAGWITRPLKRLAHSAHELREGGTQPIEGGASSYEEVRELAAVLNGLVCDLVQRRSELEQLNATLERRVDLRTKELAEALAAMKADEQRIHTIIDTAQDAFIGVDPDGYIVDWNTQAGAMFGWTRDEAIGKPVAQIVPERFRPSVDRSLRQFRENGELGLLGRRVERIINDRHGNEIPIEMTLGLVASGSRPFFSIFLHDISLRKKVEVMKNEFIATASHELRTPLTSMRISLSLLAQGTVAPLEPEVQELVGIAHRHCERLVRLVNDMLDIQRIEAGGLQLQRSREVLAPLAADAIAAMRGFALERGIELDCECVDACDGLEAEVDRDRLLQVLTNLLSNAIKFAPKDSRVTVRIEARAEGVRLSVVDRGAGIPESFRDRIFQRFAQAGGAGGSGLGLSISRGIVEEHGGSMSFTSVAGQGTSFHVDLPGLAIPACVSTA